tara:strand:+ start:104 stop:241 length:138 start_codon:yes stop_codon:yes gene_type:complete
MKNIIKVDFYYLQLIYQAQTNTKKECFSLALDHVIPIKRLILLIL